VQPGESPASAVAASTPPVAWQRKTSDVLVDAGERVRLDRRAGLLAHIPAQSIRDRLPEFQHAAGWLPPAVVAAAHD